MKKLILLFIISLVLFVANEKFHIIGNNLVKIKNISQKEVIYLYKNKQQDKVYGFKVQIYGNIEGKAKITMYQKFTKRKYIQAKNCS